MYVHWTTLYVHSNSHTHTNYNHAILFFFLSFLRSIVICVRVCVCGCGCYVVDNSLPLFQIISLINKQWNAIWMEMKSLIRGDINGAAMNETVDKWGEGGWVLRPKWNQISNVNRWMWSVCEVEKETTTTQPSRNMRMKYMGKITCKIGLWRVSGWAPK